MWLCPNSSRVRAPRSCPLVPNSAELLSGTLPEACNLTHIRECTLHDPDPKPDWSLLLDSLKLVNLPFQPCTLVISSATVKHHQGSAYSHW